MNADTRALLSEAFAIIDGIPDDAIRFGAPRSIKGPTLDDGTVCSPEGWLAQHPRFIERGLRLTEDGSAILYRGEGSASVPAALPMARALGLPLDEARRLFGQREEFTANPDNPLTDKQLWEQRVREVLGKAHSPRAEVQELAETGSLDPHFGHDVPL
ncbi:hypothetical protein SAMN06265795_11663 [Noviherbaspirillum humi]|uniref:Uncharacterized protein n=1 Tax=Noviherbaspirillum humi TaxID=1688639 RepID=A0A239KMD4_9BURK|nr:hypothetical protein [Noviherbaspirillum humi]SNT18783.1 hypothetical protein SAMN06265795_11663 [Noviherbaspirillum humi]